MKSKPKAWHSVERQYLLITFLTVVLTSVIMFPIGCAFRDLDLHMKEGKLGNSSIPVTQEIEPAMLPKSPSFLIPN